MAWFANKSLNKNISECDQCFTSIIRITATRFVTANHFIGPCITIIINTCCAKAKPRIAWITVALIISNDSNSHGGIAIEIYIKPLSFAVVLKRWACDEGFPCSPCSVSGPELSVCDHAVQRTCGVVQCHPFSLSIVWHTQANFCKRSVPIWSQLAFFFWYSFQSILCGVCLLVFPKGRVISKCILRQKQN